MAPVICAVEDALNAPDEVSPFTNVEEAVAMSPPEVFKVKIVVEAAF